MRQIKRQRDRETERQRDRETERQRDRETERQRDRDRQIDRQLYVLLQPQTASYNIQHLPLIFNEEKHHQMEMENLNDKKFN
jgi:hypothetical protein